VRLEYSLGLDTSAEVRMGDGLPVGVQLPAGSRRVYIVAEGAGRDVTVSVSTPNASLCVLNVTVGELVDGPRVGPDVN
jgi:hypothetical protein